MKIIFVFLFSQESTILHEVARLDGIVDSLGAEEEWLTDKVEELTTHMWHLNRDEEESFLHQELMDLARRTHRRILRELMEEREEEQLRDMEEVGANRELMFFLLC